MKCVQCGKDFNVDDSPTAVVYATDAGPIGLCSSACDEARCDAQQAAAPAVPSDPPAQS